MNTSPQGEQSREISVDPSVESAGVGYTQPLAAAQYRLGNSVELVKSHELTPADTCLPG